MNGILLNYDYRQAMFINGNVDFINGNDRIVILEKIHCQKKYHYL
jgi:hypothetical protein